MKVYQLREYFDSAQNTGLSLGIFASRDKAEEERKRILSQTKNVERIDTTHDFLPFMTHDCFVVVEREVIDNE